jgi:tetratricopeptide (TPR) repeat protein
MPPISSHTSSPVVARFHHLLGLAMEWCGWQAGAEHAFRDALRVNPSFPSAHYRLGEALGRQGRWREASRAFQQAVRLDPSSAELQGNLVLALARADQWTAVAEELDRLAALRPREGEIFMLLGAVLKRLRRHHEAIRAFRWAVRLELAPTGKRFFLGEELLGPRGWQAVLCSWSQAKGLPPAPDGAPAAEGQSPLHRHPGPPLDAAGGRRRTAPHSALDRLATRLDAWGDRLRPPEVPFSDVLAREEEERSILRVYREARPFPVDDGGGQVRVHRGAAAVLERRRRGHA